MNSNGEIYFDNSATTAVSKPIAEKMLQIMTEDYGNASAAYSKGLVAANLVKAARENIAALLMVRADEIYFNSGGSEGNNTAIVGIAQANRKKGQRILVSAVEHPSVLATAKSLVNYGFEVKYIPVQPNGVVDVEQLKILLTDDTILVSIQYVNNEMGAVQPIREIGALLHNHQALFHVDGVQAIGKLKVDLYGCQIDVLTASGHKIHGPKGCGLIYIKKGTHILPLILGGGQEKGFRSGTENVAADCGLSMAMTVAYHDLAVQMEHMQLVRDTLAQEILKKVPDVFINSNLDENGVCHILNVSFPGARSEVLLHYLEAQNIFVSAGSACSAKKTGASHVLTAMGLNHDLLDSAIRFSFSHLNTVAEAIAVSNVLATSVPEIRMLMQSPKKKRR